MNHKIANILSAIFHPVFLPTYTILILFALKSYLSAILPVKLKFIILGIIVLITILIPLFFTYLFLLKGIIQTEKMENKHERILPYLISCVFFYLCYHILRQLPIPQTYEMFMLGATFIILISFIINFFWLISIHMAAIGGITGLLAGLYYQQGIDTLCLLSVFILLSGLLGTARLSLNAHKPVQVYTGFMAGFSIMFVIILFGLSY